MWESNTLTSHRGISVRRLLTSALAALLAALLWTLLVAAPTFAADLSWNGSSITQDDKTYVGPVDKSILDRLNLLDGTKAYTYVDPAPTGSAPADRKMHVIYFASDTDVAGATAAKYKTYTYKSPTDISNPSSPTDLSIEPQTSAAAAGTDSCATGGQLGWIVCPLTNGLAAGMDWVFDVLSGFLAVRPMETGQTSALYRAWSWMRSFANVAFVIAFLIIIYSQITGGGFTNYSLKKILPRLIVAAILVNLSFVVCSIAIDLSNILGFSLQGIFIDIRNSLVGAEGNSWDVMSWESISSFILSGGALVAAGSIGGIMALSTYGLAGALMLLLPALMIAIVSVLVALLIMAARQALITVLVVISPLAFVAYLLPNTEKWFSKWRTTFMTMLILFPAFSLIFGGSQLAASVIIQNADSINLIILGMLVQVAPLIITPMLIKLSGSIVGRLAGMVNNPNKGLIDRTRNFAKDRTDNIKDRRLGTEARKGILGAAQRNAQRVDHTRRKRELQRKIHGGMADNRFSGSHDNHVLHEAMHAVETEHKTIEERLSRDLNMKIKVTPELIKKELELRVLSDESASAKSKIDKIHEDFRAGTNTHGAALANIMRRSEDATRDIALTGIATQTAKRVQQNRLSDALLENTQRVDGQLLRDYAGGIDLDNGADSALTYAVNVQREAAGKIVNERTQLIKHFKLDGANRQQLAMGDDVASVDGDGHAYTFRADDAYTREAAIEMQLKTGSFDDKVAIIGDSGTGGFDFRTTISDGIPQNGIPGAAPFLGGRFINEVGLGNVRSDTDVEFWAAQHILDGKFKAKDLAAADANALKYYVRAAQNSTAHITPDKAAQFATSLTHLKMAVQEIFDNPELKSQTSDVSDKVLQDIRNL